MKKALAFLFALVLAMPAFAANPKVEMKTSMGAVVIELYPDKAPKTVENFLLYVKDGFYNGTVFHRVIDGFMIQGGGYDVNLKEKDTRAPIPNESKNGLRNEAGTIAMARTNDPHSATAQFFINLVDNAGLDGQRKNWGYAVFGKVVQGFDVVQKIGKSPTGSTGFMFQNLPKTAIVIESVKLLPDTK